MSKRLIQIDHEETSSTKDPISLTKSVLKNKYSCYVLITCSAPDKDGKMNVEMNFEGDEDLASMLVDNAAQIFDARIPRQESK